jgi:uncharacterized protein YbjT (DUF2867 family)
MAVTNAARPVLVTGATGYLGGRLVPRLLAEGWRVRVVARAPGKLAGREWSRHPDLEIVGADVGDASALRAAMQGCGAAYYLVHSMLVAGTEYAERDAQLAQTFAREAEAAGIERIIYMGGLGETGTRLSEHLASRREVERLLASTSVPVTVLRAAMIIGSGSASFEIMRYLVERLPAMITPSWVQTKVQPIAVRNVLGYLVSCLTTPETIGRTLDIGGPDVLTYEEFLQLVAEVRGLRRRWILRVPVLTPRLSSLWIHLVTPLRSEIARPLAEGLRNPVLCRDDEAQRLMPQELLTVREAVEAAYSHQSAGTTETSWSDAGPILGDPDWSGGQVFVDCWHVQVRATAAETFQAVCRIGGGHGYHRGDWLWRVRGWMDKLVGGPGLRRGRREPQRVRFGDALDFWRVTAVEQDRRLELRAEMRLPGEAQLAFELSPDESESGVRLTQTARFIPKGLFGLLYWYAVLPLHGFVFRGMLEGIRDEAERRKDGAGAVRDPSPGAPWRRSQGDGA